MDVHRKWLRQYHAEWQRRNGDYDHQANGLVNTENPYASRAERLGPDTLLQDAGADHHGEEF